MGVFRLQVSSHEGVLSLLLIVRLTLSVAPAGSVLFTPSIKYILLPKSSPSANCLHPIPDASPWIL